MARKKPSAQEEAKKIQAEIDALKEKAKILDGKPTKAKKTKAEEKPTKAKKTKAEEKPTKA
ncbi:MAG: transcriptional regulator, partial [Nitrosopumilaceae archaeon]|nr:transcriptional regulator [Nitrosopumilaceae archaeon]